MGLRIQHISSHLSLNCEGHWGRPPPPPGPGKLQAHPHTYTQPKTNPRARQQVTFLQSRPAHHSAYFVAAKVKLCQGIDSRQVVNSCDLVARQVQHSQLTQVIQVFYTADLKHKNADLSNAGKQKKSLFLWVIWKGQFPEKTAVCLHTCCQDTHWNLPSHWKLSKEENNIHLQRLSKQSCNKC